MININKLDLNQAALVLEIYKKRIAIDTCGHNRICVEAIDLCSKKGLLSLKFKGFAIAYDLQNPYVCLVPMSGTALRVNSIINYLPVLGIP